MSRRPSVAAPLLAVALLVGVAACSSEPGLDREAAIDELIDRYPGAMSREQAGCYVDRVVAEVGAEQLGADADPTDDQVRRLTAIRVDCLGVADLGLPPTTTTTTPLTTDGDGATGSVPEQPSTFGDDPELDGLWVDCEGGSGAACDQLFEAAPLGSDYERFGATCGGRGAEPVCAEVYPG